MLIDGFGPLPYCENLNKRRMYDPNCFFFNFLQKFGDPVKTRHREYEERPRALEDLGGTLQLTRKALDLYLAKDEKYAHIDEKKIEEVKLVTCNGQY